MYHGIIHGAIYLIADLVDHSHELYCRLTDVCNGRVGEAEL